MLQTSLRGDSFVRLLLLLTWSFLIINRHVGFPAGFFAEWFGAKSVTTIALIVSLLLTATTPIMADWSMWAVYANRIALGLAGVCLKLHFNIA